MEHATLYLGQGVHEPHSYAVHAQVLWAFRALTPIPSKHSKFSRNRRACREAGVNEDTAQSEGVCSGRNLVVLINKLLPSHLQLYFPPPRLRDVRTFLNKRRSTSCLDVPMPATFVSHLLCQRRVVGKQSITGIQVPTHFPISFNPLKNHFFK